jgi:hypothetical protein
MRPDEAPQGPQGGRLWRAASSYAYGSEMEQHDRVPPPPGQPAYDEEAPLDDGYSQSENYGHNQEFMQLHDPSRYADAPPGEPRVERAAEPKAKRRRASGLGTYGAAGIPDSHGESHTGFGDPDRD